MLFNWFNNLCLCWPFSSDGTDFSLELTNAKRSSVSLIKFGFKLTAMFILIGVEFGVEAFEFEFEFEFELEEFRLDT